MAEKLAFEKARNVTGNFNKNSNAVSAGTSWVRKQKLVAKEFW
jgi:hypothetical protein